MSAVIIGGGPVGLLLGLFLINAGFTDVTLLDSRIGFERRQVLILNRETTSFILPRKILTALFKFGACYVHIPANNLQAICYTRKAKYRENISININVLEELLNAECKRKGVKIYRGINDLKIDKRKSEVTFAEAARPIPYKFLIGADGYNSFIRSTIFNDKVDLLFPKDTEFVALFVFKFPKNKVSRIVSKTRDNDTKFLPAPQNRIRSFRLRNGTVTIAISLDQHEFQSLGETFDSSPIVTKIIKEYIPEYGYLYSDLQKYFQKVIKVPINIQKSQEFYKKIGKAHYFLIGDAAYNVHFFSGSGVNRGFEQAVFLMTRLRLYTQDSEVKHFTEYNAGMKVGAVLAFRDSLFNHLDKEAAITLCEKGRNNDWESVKNFPVGIKDEKERCYIGYEYLLYDNPPEYFDFPEDFINFAGSSFYEYALENVDLPSHTFVSKGVKIYGSIFKRYYDYQAQEIHNHVRGIQKSFNKFIKANGLAYIRDKKYSNKEKLEFAEKKVTGQYGLLWYEEPAILDGLWPRKALQRARESLAYYLPKTKKLMKYKPSVTLTVFTEKIIKVPKTIGEIIVYYYAFHDYSETLYK